MIDSKQGATPETLPATTKLITSLREQKGREREAISLIDQTLRVAKKQVEYLKKLYR